MFPFLVSQICQALISYLNAFMRWSSGGSDHLSNFFHIARGDAIAKALAQIIGTVAIIKVPLGGGSCGQTINFLLSRAMAVMLKVDTKIEVACKEAATGQAAG